MLQSVRVYRVEWQEKAAGYYLTILDKPIHRGTLSRYCRYVLPYSFKQNLSSINASRCRQKLRIIAMKMNSNEAEAIPEPRQIRMIAKYIGCLENRYIPAVIT